MSKFPINGGNNITEANFVTCNFLVPFDLTPDQCNASKTGTMELKHFLRRGADQRRDRRRAEDHHRAAARSPCRSLAPPTFRLLAKPTFRPMNPGECRPRHHARGLDIAQAAGREDAGEASQAWAAEPE